MAKKILLFSALMMAVSVADVYAVPTVRKIGVNPTVATAKNPVTVKTSNATIAKSATTSTIKASTKQTPVARATSASTERFPTVGNLGTALKQRKQIATPTTTTTPSTTTPVTSGVSESDLAAVESRVNDLESNAITEVVETEGNYVSGVSMQGNTLTVNKTSILSAPVKSQNSDTITGTAEIWIIK